MRVLRAGACKDGWVRDLNELTAVEDPAWPHVAEMIAGSPMDVKVLPGDPAEPMRELLGLHSEFHRQLGGDDPGFLGRIS